MIFETKSVSANNTVMKIRIYYARNGHFVHPIIAQNILDFFFFNVSLLLF